MCAVTATLEWAPLRERLRARFPDGAWPEAMPAQLEGREAPLETCVDDFVLAFAAGRVLSARDAVVALLDGALERWMQARAFPEALRDDALQQVRVKVLGTGEVVGALASYEGRAPLAQWLSVVGARIAISVLRANGPKDGHDSLEEESWHRMPDSQASPELAVLRAQFRERFQDALSKALARLDERGRVLLSMRYGQGVQVDPLAQMYQVHRVTMAKWLRDAGTLLGEYLQAELGRVAGFTESDADQLSQYLGSAPDLSLERLFALSEGDTPRRAR